MQTLEPFTYTHVEYEAGDVLGPLWSLASLLPIAWLVSLATLLASRRDLATAALLCGQLLNEVLNKVLKRTLRVPRPTTLHPHAPEFGMPSNHAQFAAFAAVYVALWAMSGRWHVSVTWRRVAAVVALLAAAAVCASRLALRYHSAEQVAVGAAMGAIAAAAWFGAVEAWLRPHFANIVAHPLSRALLIRDCTHAHALADEYAAVASAHRVI